MLYFCYFLQPLFWPHRSHLMETTLTKQILKETISAKNKRFTVRRCKSYNQINVIDNMGEDTQKTQDFTEAHPGNTSLHGEYTVNGASGLDELYVKDNDRITVEFKADEDYFLKDVIYNGKSMLGSLKETYASDGSSQGSVSFNINNTSAVQTLEVQFSPEWAYSTALSGGNIVLSRYVGRNTVVNMPFIRNGRKPVSNKL